MGKPELSDSEVPSPHTHSQAGPGARPGVCAALKSQTRTSLSTVWGPQADFTPNSGGSVPPPLHGAGLPSRRGCQVALPSLPVSPESHLESCSPGLWWYIPVRTGMYRYVLFYSTYRYVLLEIQSFRMTVHTTYWYTGTYYRKII